MRKFLALPLLLLLTVFSVNSANADVALVDGNINEFSDEESFDNGFILNGGLTDDTQAGDFVVIHCGTENDGEPDNSFFPPTPGDWTELDNGPCGQDGCAQGIWGIFTDTDDVENIQCSWNEPTFVFAAASYRYRNVDRDNPIIDVECDTGTSDLVIAPSIDVEPGSQVYGVATLSVETGLNCDLIENEITPFLYIVCSNFDGDNVVVTAQTFPSFEGGPTGDIELPLPEEADWRACTIGIRMAPEARAIPTMSEWGFMAVAVFMGAAGVWYLRRRQKAI